MDPTERARDLFFKALEHHQRGRLEAAEALYREALALVPGRVSVISNLGGVLVQQGRHEEAQVLAERALTLDPDCNEAQAILVEIKRSRQGPLAALADLDRALAETPDDPDLHFQRSSLLAELGRFAEALVDSARGLAIRPGHPTPRTHHALLRAAVGELAEAQAELGALLAEDARALAAGEAWTQLLMRRAAEAGGVLPESIDPQLLAKALDTPWAPPRRLLGLACQALHADPRTGPWLQRVQQLWPQPLPPHSAADLRLGAAIYSHPLLRALLRQPVIPDTALQRLLAQLRAFLLERALRSPADQPWDEALQSFHCALAAHCLRQQHAWPVGDAELAALAELQSALKSAIAADTAPHPGVLPALLSYLPLRALAAADALKSQRWPAPVQALLAQADADPGVLPSLRWTHLPASPRSLPLGDYLAERIAPFAAPSLPVAHAPRVLALAAGAGEWAFELALRLRGAQLRVLEHDATAAAALAEQAGRLRLPNLQVAAGGLESAGAGGYTVIDSGRALLLGPRPLAWLSELRPWLAPRGLLRLRVASGRLRAALRSARAQLAAAGLGNEDADLRRARALLQTCAENDPARALVALPELHALGACRSLLFQYDDSPLDLIELAQQLQRAGLRLRGFELEPDDRVALPRSVSPPADLPGWAALEASQPRMFSAFYTVWASPA
jgi:Flp pilus assembly protein TadD